MKKFDNNSFKVDERRGSVLFINPRNEHWAAFQMLHFSVLLNPLSTNLKKKKKKKKRKNTKKKKKKKKKKKRSNTLKQFVGVIQLFFVVLDTDGSGRVQSYASFTEASIRE